ncbi:hypothetical protein FHR20_002291 [Sphingomonas leidyi]|uniref:DUF4365 domain-containing protein n=1 Tax=Sphingomonas leidyi TaxID=68569 RepID=A0A7X5UZX1_9SPHN|nr:DUF4365 domain-containing protein [Sphingomonas leidyi]NIJ65329.1 hypothetical protein [Sphingomonas leidyi]
MAMKLPKRPKAHLTEAEAWKILQTCAPSTWIVREVTERDYGIDAYVEISDREGNVTGDLISIQLKGTDSITWRGEKGNRIATSPSIATSTANYWERLPVPVFLFVADVQAKDIWFAPVKPTIRREYGKLSDQETMTFGLKKKLRLRSKVGPALVEVFGRRERLQRDFVFHLTNIVSNAGDFHQFIDGNQGRDAHMEVASEVHLRFVSLYQSCEMVAYFLGVNWTVDSLNELHRRDHEVFQDDFVMLHELTLDQALAQLEPLFPKLLRGAVELISKSERAYWKAMQPVLYAQCSSGELEWTIKSIEERIAASEPYRRKL